jgi:MFS transporter, SP family, major inositol transporter
MLINRINRRTMLLSGYALIVTFHVLIGLSAWLIPDGSPFPNPGIRGLLCVLDAGHTGPTGLADAGRNLPPQDSKPGNGSVCSSCSEPNAGVAFGFPPVVAAFGIAPTFFVFAGLGTASWIFIKTSVPETRGKTLEEFEEEYSAAHPARA